MLDVIVSNVPVSQKGTIVQYTRDDGFTVFLDNDKDLDYIRLHCEPATVIKAVAIRRCQQIARNYARKYAPTLLNSFQIPSTPLIKLLQK